MPSSTSADRSLKRPALTQAGHPIRILFHGQRRHEYTTQPPYAQGGREKKIHAAHTPPETPDSPCFIGCDAYPREARHKNVCLRHPSMTKKFRFFEESFAARGTRMGWTHEVGESGRLAPRAARILRAPGRGWGGRGLGRDGEPSHICRC